MIASLLALCSVPAWAEEPAPAGTKPEQATAKVTKDTFEVSVTAPATCGGEAAAALLLAPRGPYKFNKAYPTSVTVTAPAGVTLPKPKQKKADATTVGEAGATFTIPYACTPTATGDLEAEAKFSVCNDQVCKLLKEKIAWSVAPAPAPAGE